MTTIAATRSMMAADSRVSMRDRECYKAIKIFRVKTGELIGAAGDNEAIQIFFDWWPVRHKVKRVIPRRLRFEGVVLTREGLLVFERRGPPDVINQDCVAIGSGAATAMAAFDTMRALNRKLDPVLAVRVACGRDNHSGGPVQVLKLRGRR